MEGRKDWTSDKSMFLLDIEFKHKVMIQINGSGFSLTLSFWIIKGIIRRRRVLQSYVL